LSETIIRITNFITTVYSLRRELAHNINFDDNKLMINKIKDFLKNKLNRQKMKDLSDQNGISESENLDEDQTGETPLPEFKPSIKEKFSEAFSRLRSPKTKKELSDSDLTGETPIPYQEDLSPTWKDKFSQSLSRFKAKLAGKRARAWTTPGAKENSKDKSSLLLSPSLSQNIEKFLSREARETIHQVALVAIVASVTYSLGKVSALIVRGGPALDSARDYRVTLDLSDNFNAGTLSQVRSINIFRTNTGLGAKKKVADTKCEKAQQQSSLPIKLVNTIVLQDTVKSLASVQVRGERSLKELREGEQIDNLAKIFKITRLEILVRNLESGVCESIASDKAKEARSPISVMSPAQSRQYVANKKISGIENVGNKFTISKALLDEKIKDLASILTQARAVKIQNPDGSLSFKMTEMDPEGIFPYLGLQDQDIITSINGKPINDLNEVMSLFGRIKNLDNLQLGIKREGATSVQEYSIKK